MQINKIDNSINFTSVIPVRVFYDGLEATGKTNIMRGCQKAINVMCGPIKQNPEFDTALRYLHYFDKDYSYYRAINGFDKTGNITCSVMCNKGYIFTGNEANALKNNGKEIGSQKRICNDLGIVSSYEHKNAKLSYRGLVKRFISQKSRHLNTKIEENGKIVNKPVVMEIHMSEPKKNKFKLDKILFTKA